MTEAFENVIFEWTPPKKKSFKNTKWTSFLAFQVMGVKIGIRSNSDEIISRVENGLPFLLPIDIKMIPFEDSDHRFTIYLSNGKKKRKYWLSKDNEDFVEYSYSEENLDTIDSKIRLTVAEFAEDYVFLHAGAVGYKGKAIIIPAKSFSGKTTLVAELAKRGLAYYSDEYAVLDKDGRVHPFTKKLSMRGIIDDYKQVDIDVEEMGGKKGTEPIPVGLILVSKYIKNARFTPKLVSSGEGIIESIANSVSIRQNPKFVLKVLSIITNSAKIMKTKRGEADKFADKFLPFLDNIEF